MYEKLGPIKLGFIFRMYPGDDHISLPLEPALRTSCCHLSPELSVGYLPWVLASSLGRQSEPLKI